MSIHEPLQLARMKNGGTASKTGSLEAERRMARVPCRINCRRDERKDARVERGEGGIATASFPKTVTAKKLSIFALVIKFLVGLRCLI
jgi:hypothetical protein